jgi:type II secretory pathway pseudopilin PulG
MCCLNRTRRPGLTLLELLISISVTAFIGLGVALILQAAAYGTSTKRDARRVSVRAETLRDRLDDAVRNSASFLASGTNYLVIWQGDENDDTQVNLSELQLIELNTTTQTLTSYVATLPVGTDTAYAATVDFNSTTQTLKGNGTLTGTTWATGISAVTFTLDNVTPQQAVLLTWSVTLNNGTQTEPVSGAVSLRQPLTPQ